MSSIVLFPFFDRVFAGLFRIKLRGIFPALLNHILFTQKSYEKKTPELSGVF